MRPLPLMLAVGATVGLGSASPAFADQPAGELHAKCFVRMIKASHDAGGGIDPKITRLRPYLEKAPFTAWKSFSLVDEKDMTVAPNTTDRFQLPNGKQASLSYVDHVLSPQGKHRLRLKLEIDKEAKKEIDTTFVLDEGGVVFTAGQKYAGGMLILGVSCDIPND